MDILKYKIMILLSGIFVIFLSMLTIILSKYTVVSYILLFVYIVTIDLLPKTDIKKRIQIFVFAIILIILFAVLSLLAGVDAIMKDQLLILGCCYLPILMYKVISNKSSSK